MASKEKTISSPSESATSDVLESGEINEVALVRKLDQYLLPGLTVLYLLSFLDRSNVANARIEGLTDDISITGNQYLTGLTLFFLGYVIFEIPCNIILKKTTPRLWLPTLTIAFGIVATLLGVVQNMAGFFVARFVLGAVESGLFPGAVFYLSVWYKRKERQFRVALFFSAAALAGAFGGILAWGIAHMDGVGGQKGWRWIFILEGLLTVVVGASAYFFIFNYPDTAKFLNQAERNFIHKRLEADSDASEDEAFSWGNVKAAVVDPKCWLYCFGFHFMSLPLYTLSLFLPSIIKALGYKAAQAQLLSIPPYALATILTVSVAYASERTGRRAPYLLASALVAAIGYCILLGNQNPTARPGVSYVGTFFAAAGIYPATALVLSWPAINVGGQTKRAIANAMQISIGNLGAVIGTQLYRTEDTPEYVVGHSVALGYCCASALLTAFTWWYLSRQNKLKERAQPGTSGVVGGSGGLKGDTDARWRFMT
ncbi:MFS transporter [Polychaeton citri CBS 116435]|uniref:MFS transporter n=1 Tax=Polychaeton citri CBS 116435 TaxID=1314669 RepID=A0A9P4USU4_9PEZI|nr:MFS transporter [Polychaeton citri CBS 116435]